MAYAQGELECRNDLPKNEKSPLPTSEIKISVVADTSPVKLNSTKRDQRANSASKKQKTNPKSENLQKNSSNIDKSWNEDILLPLSRADSGSNIDVYITDDSNRKLRSSTSNQRMTVVGKKGQTAKGTAISKQIVTDNNLNKLEDISSCPRKVGRYKQYEIKTSTMVDNSPLKLRSSKSNKITSVTMLKATDEETTSKQKKISSQSDENSAEMIQTFQNKVKKDRKTKLKVSTVTVASPVKLRSSKVRKVTKSVSNPLPPSKIEGQEKRNVTKNKLEKTEESEFSLTKEKDINANLETEVKLRRSKRTRK